jgi:ABC-type lipoprotein release transport system permease subunit
MQNELTIVLGIIAGLLGFTTGGVALWKVTRITRRFVPMVKQHQERLDALLEKSNGEAV